MNKYVVSTLVVATFLGATVLPALAEQSPSPTPTRSGLPVLRRELNQEVKDIRENTRQEIASKSRELQAKLKEKRDLERKDRITKFWRKTAERLQKLINREKKVADKISARLDRLTTAGRDPAKITEIKAALTAAQAKIDVAQAALTDATAQIKQMITDGKPTADIIAKARELHKGVVAKIREAHKALIDVLVSTRGLSVTPTPTPSTSVAPTPTP